MRRRSLSLLLALLGLSGAFGTARGGDDPPGWLIAAAKMATPERAKGAPAVDLVHESRVRVESNGKMITVRRRAVRILTREGREEAVAREYYLAGSGSVRALEAWMIQPNGRFLAFGKEHAIDASIVQNDVYQEGRVRGIVATDDAEVGAVFGSESVTEDVSEPLQLRWSFQDRIPVVASRFAVVLPPGWNAQAFTFNHPPIEARREGEATVWSTGDLPYLREEPWSPPLTSLAPRLAVTIIPPPQEPRWSATRFEDWKGVARWIEALAEPQSSLTPALVAKSRALVDGQTGEWERIESIARYVQGVHYISIQTGLARGGGYRPHAAGEVFTKSYGDCKDKANLFRTMLRAVDIPAHLVLISADDPDFVREEWPSPYQFNHCIAAVEVSDGVQGPAVIETGSRRLLIFDPTDPATPLGELPFEEQGSLALLAAGASSGLVRLPAPNPEHHGIERTVEGALSADGTLTATLVERALGREATDRRREYRALSQANHRKQVERWISESIPGATVSKLEVKDDFRRNRFDVEIGFEARRFVRPLPGGLLALKPLNLDGSRWLPRSARRAMPLLVTSASVLETTKLLVPDGYQIEDVPDPIRTEASFGAVQASCEMEGGAVRFRKRLDLKRTLLPAESFETAARFFDQWRSTNQVSVVLAPATLPAPASSR